MHARRADEVAALDGIDLDGIEVIDAVAWAHDHLLPELEVRAPRGLGGACTPPARRATSASRRAIEALARALADEVHVPLVATCCGMAGDRGLLHPELIGVGHARRRRPR